MEYIDYIKTNNLHQSPSILKENQKIYSDCLILNTYLDKGCVVGERSFIQKSSIGLQTRIDRDNQIQDSVIGDRSYTGRFSLIFKTKIGKFSSLSYGVVLGAAGHNMTRATTHPFIYKNNFYGLCCGGQIESDLFDYDLSIGNDVWIGANCTIIRNLEIGHGAVIGANSFVNKDIPPYAIAVGSPCKVIGFRFTEDIISKLLTLKWWNWDDNKIDRNKSFFCNQLSYKSFDTIVE